MAYITMTPMIRPKESYPSKNSSNHLLIRTKGSQFRGIKAGVKMLGISYSQKGYFWRAAGDAKSSQQCMCYGRDC